MASARLSVCGVFVVLLAAAVVPLYAHEVNYAATITNGSTTVGTVALVSWHEGPTAWINFTIILTTANTTISAVTINDGPLPTLGEVVLNLSRAVDLAGLASSGSDVGQYEDTAENVSHVSHQPGAHYIEIVTSKGTLRGALYHSLRASPGQLAVKLVGSDKKTVVGNATLSFKDNADKTTNASLNIVLFPPKALKGVPSAVSIEEEDGRVLHTWTPYVNLTNLSLYGETSVKFVVNKTEAEHILEEQAGHFLSLTTSNDSARGSFTMPAGSALPAPAPAPAPSSALAAQSSIMVAICTSLVAIVTVLSLTL